MPDRYDDMARDCIRKWEDLEDPVSATPKALRISVAAAIRKAVEDEREWMIGAVVEWAKHKKTDDEKEVCYEIKDLIRARSGR